ncbi:MAG: lytic murein transglycosylase B [Methylobacter sp.]|jgi:membrane-bound lytic murein transglycosylase B
MKLKTILAPITLSCVCLIVTSCAVTEIKEPATTTTVTGARTDAINAFIRQMVATHQFNESELHDLFESIEIKNDILKRISSPSEGLPWYKYRKIFLTEARINSGVQFWRENEQALAAAEKQYGVPAEIIIAIIGVETLYGKNTGNHRVIDALSTLAFAYPPRSKFFLSELENYLLLCRDEHINPTDSTGSYAGAMGMPQFMPSSFRTYAVDFDNDNHRDIWHNKSDVIASIANYFAKHHWQAGQAIAVPVTAKDENYKLALNKDLKPNLSLTELESLNLTISRQLPLDSKVKLLSFEQQQGEELWAGLDNFYVITRYNHSPLYAMAVYQLSQSILNKKGSFP